MSLIRIEPGWDHSNQSPKLNSINGNASHMITIIKNKKYIFF